MAQLFVAVIFDAFSNSLSLACTEENVAEAFRLNPAMKYLIQFSLPLIPLAGEGLVAK